MKTPDPTASRVPLLTHLPLDILADDNFKCIFFNEIDKISIRISLKFAPGNSILNKPALVQVMDLCRIGDKPLFEQTLTRLTHMRHKGETSQQNLAWIGNYTPDKLKNVIICPCPNL